MAVKKKKTKSAKKRAKNYEPPLKLQGSFDSVMKTLLSDDGVVKRTKKR